MKSVNTRLAEELAVSEAQVAAAVRLLDEGATVPFIARYRKEVTGSLDDTQLRTLEERLAYLRELDDRRAAVLASIEEQGKLTDQLRAALMAADTKSRVEDIYLPYKPKRRTKAQIAREAGLEPLADRLLSDPTLVPDDAAAEFIGEQVADTAAALDGARQILIERAAEDAELVGVIRGKFWVDGALRTKPWSEEAARSPEAQKFRDYFEFSEPLESMPSHRVLAVMRGEKEQALALSFDGGDDEVYQAMVAQTLGVEIQPLGVREPDDFEEAFAAMRREMPDGILMVSDALTTLNRQRVYDFAAEHHVPAIYEFDFLVRDGGLMAYGPDQDESFERVAALVDRILKGAKPADLPFEEPTRFRLAINLKTAKALGLAVPDWLLGRADEVIE